MCDLMRAVRDVEKWPRSIRQAVDGIATVFTVAMQLAMERRRSLSGAVAHDAERQTLWQENRDLRIEIGLWRSRFKAIPPKNRPHFKPADRLIILRLIWSGFWTVKTPPRGWS